MVDWHNVWPSGLSRWSGVCNVALSSVGLSFWWVWVLEMPMICNYNSPDSPLPCCSSWCWLIGMTREWEFALSTFCLKISRNSTCLTSFRTGNQRNLFTSLHKVRPSFYWITGIVWYTSCLRVYTWIDIYIFFCTTNIEERTFHKQWGCSFIQSNIKLFLQTVCKTN